MQPNSSDTPDAPLPERLRDFLGFHTYRPGQEQAVKSALGGRDTLVVMPTGSGKSLCFQLSAMSFENDHVTVVVSPLISLIKDQIDNLLNRGIWAVELNSTLTAAQQKNAEKYIALGRTPIAYVTPERLADPKFRKLLKARGVAM